MGQPPALLFLLILPLRRNPVNQLLDVRFSGGSWEAEPFCALLTFSDCPGPFENWKVLAMSVVGTSMILSLHRPDAVGRTWIGSIVILLTYKYDGGSMASLDCAHGDIRSGQLNRA